MKAKLFGFLKSDTSKDVIVNTIGNYLNIFFTAFFAILLVRLFSPEEYGVLSVLLAISYVMANLLDFGATATIYANLPGLVEKNTDSKYSFLKSIFIFQTVLSSLTIIAVWLYFPQIDKLFFKTDASTLALNLTALSVLFFIWQNFITNSLFATKKFLIANVYTNISNVLKLFFILGVYFFGKISIEIILLSFGIVGPLTVFFLFLKDRFNVLKKILTSNFDKESIKFRYTITYFLASQFYNLALRMDLFLLSFFGLKPEVGYYGLAQKIILTISASAVSISQVLSPQFAQIKSRNEFYKIIKTGFIYMSLPCILFAILFFVPKEIFALVFTNSFEESGKITNFLAIPFLLSTLGIIPHLLLLYTFKTPKYTFLSNLGMLIVVSACAYYLIPLHGMYALPWALSIGFLVAMAIQTFGILIEYYKKFRPTSKLRTANL